MTIKNFLCCFILAVALIFSLSSTSSYAQERSLKVKAVFLFKFAGYITWPQGNQNLTLCTYGSNPFGSLLAKTGHLQKEPMKIKNIRSGGSINSCNILYIAKNTNAPNTKGKSILTVSEASKFAQKGGTIEMRETDERMGLVINVKVLKSSNLEASSRLLDIATLIR